ncbi:MAG: glycosyltransferase family 1 protein [Bacteroidota bacterium]|nr:glycosyltransferase family 1 protein [Bacteroidota bacterium]
MNIVVNTRLLIENKLDGIGWFTYHTLKRITKNHPEHHFFFLFDRKYSEKFIFSDNITPIVLIPQTRHPFLWEFWLKISIPLKLKKIDADIFISPDGFLPTRLQIPSLNVIHDINFAHFPKDLPFFSRLFYNHQFPKFAKKATRIATVSEYSKTDLINSYSISSEKISVVYNGSDASYKPVTKDITEKIKNKYSKGNDFFIFVGSVHPRKNLIRLIKAFDKFKAKTSHKHKLLIVGDLFFKNSELFKIFNSLEFKNDIIFTGRMELKELSLLVASASAMTFVPYFEGFGIPILEAMNCDVPIISSNITSMPEVAGNAALYVDPYNIDEISEAMIKIIEDKELRNSLIEKGKIQREKFSWDKTADKLWKAIENTMEK